MYANYFLWCTFRFIYVPAPHTAKLLAKVLMECLIEWSIERKLSTLTLDN